MKKIAEKDSKETARMAIARGLAAVVRRDLHAFVVDAGMAALQQLLEDERTAVCGPAHARQPGRKAYRNGHAPGELALGGRRVAVSRPRARSVDGDEVVLPSWEHFGDEDPLTERAVEQMLVGVTTRRYNRSLEPTPASVKTRGTSKSAVSRRFVAATERQMEAWLKRDLSTLELAVIMIDGVHVEDHVLLVALGIDTAGIKHVLGVREGATENATACTALLTDIVERGVATDKAILAVLDGAKALAKAVRNVWGNRALIQRCQVHKLRNVLDHLPEASRAAAKKAIQKAYRSSNAKEAKSLLQALHRKLADEHPGAAGSLDEGLDETLTVKRFGLPEWLERTLSTTNAIENLMGSFRRLSKNVHRWKNAKMIERWMVTAVIDAGARFRKIRGYVGMKKLIAALHAHAASLNPNLDAARKAA